MLKQAYVEGFKVACTKLALTPADSDNAILAHIAMMARDGKLQRAPGSVPLPENQLNHLKQHARRIEVPGPDGTPQVYYASTPAMRKWAKALLPGAPTPSLNPSEAKRNEKRKARKAQKGLGIELLSGLAGV